MISHLVVILAIYIDEYRRTSATGIEMFLGSIFELSQLLVHVEQIRQCFSKINRKTYTHNRLCNASYMESILRRKGPI